MRVSVDGRPNSMMGSQILQAHVEFCAVASTRRLCENARQIQAANWRAASSFPLVNYLPVAPRARAWVPTRSIMLRSYSSIVSILTKPS